MVSSKKSPLSATKYGDFLTLTPRRTKLNEYLQHHQQQQFEGKVSPKYKRNYLPKDHYQNESYQHSRHPSYNDDYLSSIDTLKLDADHNILHSKLFYQSDNSGNEYVTSHSRNPKLSIHHPPIPIASSNIVSPPNPFNDNSANKFIKL